MHKHSTMCSSTVQRAQALYIPVSQKVTGACLEGGGRRPQNCTLLCEATREICTRLSIFHGSHPLSGQRQLACREAKDPLCGAAAACTGQSIFLQYRYLVHHWCADVALQNGHFQQAPTAVHCLYEIYQVSIWVSRIGRARHVRPAAGTCTSAHSPSHAEKSASACCSAQEDTPQ